MSIGSLFPPPNPESVLEKDYKRIILDENGKPLHELSGSNGFLLPHEKTFSSVYSSLSKTYFWYDEALKNSTENALAMRRDAFVMGCLQERYLQIAQLKFHLEPENAKDPIQKKITDEMSRIVKSTKRWTQFVWQLCDAIWYGKYGNQLKWGAVPINGQKRLAVVDHRPVNGDKIQFGYDGTPKVLVHGTTPGLLLEKGLVHKDDIQYGNRAIMLRLRDPRWRQRFVIHKHNCSDADFFEGEFAGGVHGVGIRSLIYWGIWLRDEMLGWAVNHLKKIGIGGILVFYYEEGNDNSKQAAESAAKNAGERYALAMPRPRGSAKDTNHAELLAFNESGVNSMTNVIQDYFERHVERLIVGQPLSSKAESTGLGSGVANFQADCVPVEGSEILTRSGFRSAHEVRIGDEVLAYDVETDTCRWTPLLNKTFYENRPYSRLHVDGQRPFEAFCTPDHSWATQQPQRPSHWRNNPPEGELEIGTRGAGVYKDSPRKLTKANEIAKTHRVIMAAPELEEEDSLLTPTEAAILGWAVTDGHIRTRKYGDGIQLTITQSKEEHFESIRSHVDEFSGGEWIGEPTVRTFPSGNTSVCRPQHIWWLPGAAARDLLRKCDYTGKHSLPRIVTRLSFKAREAMLEAMMRAEGDKNRVFANKNQHIMEAFEILCALQGKATAKQREKLLITPSEQKELYTKRMKQTRYFTGQKLQLDDYGIGDIWCPTTKYGTWVMRQNGQVCITGNTKFRILSFDAANLADSLNEDFIPVAQKWNFPRANFMIKLVFDVPDPQAQSKLEAAGILFQTGAEIKKEELQAAAGFSKPEEDDEIVSQVKLLKETTAIQLQAQLEGAKAQMGMQQEAQAAKMQAQGGAQQQGGMPGAPGAPPDGSQGAPAQGQPQGPEGAQSQGGDQGEEFSLDEPSDEDRSFAAMKDLVGDDRGDEMLLADGSSMPLDDPDQKIDDDELKQTKQLVEGAEQSQTEQPQIQPDQPNDQIGDEFTLDDSGEASGQSHEVHPEFSLDDDQPVEPVKEEKQPSDEQNITYQRVATYAGEGMSASPDGHPMGLFVRFPEGRHVYGNPSRVVPEGHEYIDSWQHSNPLLHKAFESIPPTATAHVQGSPRLGVYPAAGHILPAGVIDHPMFHAFMRDIAANPKDAAPKLVMADWMEENGHTGFAEHLRKHFMPQMKYCSQEFVVAYKAKHRGKDWLVSYAGPPGIGGGIKIRSQQPLAGTPFATRTGPPLPSGQPRSAAGTIGNEGAKFLDPYGNPSHEPHLHFDVNSVVNGAGFLKLANGETIHVWPSSQLGHPYDRGFGISATAYPDTPRKLPRPVTIAENKEIKASLDKTHSHMVPHLDNISQTGLDFWGKGGIGRDYQKNKDEAARLMAGPMAVFSDLLEEQGHPHAQVIRQHLADNNLLYHAEEYVVAYASQHAPKGGISLAGQHFVGGQFIPSAVLAKASPQEKAALVSQKAMHGEPIHQTPAAPEDTGEVDKPLKSSEVPTMPREAAPDIQLPRENESVIDPEEFRGVLTSDRFLNLNPQMQNPVALKIRQFSQMTPGEWYKSRGQAYEAIRQVGMRVKDLMQIASNDPRVIDAQSFYIMDGYVGQRSKMFREKTLKKGISGATQTTADFLAKQTSRWMKNSKGAKRALKNSEFIGQPLANKVIGPATGMTDQSPQFHKDAVAAASLAVSDLLAETAKRGIKMIPWIIEALGKRYAAKKMGANLTMSLQDSDVPVAYQEEMEGMDDLNLIKEYLKEEFIEKMQNLPEGEREEVAHQEAERYAPIMLRLMQSGPKPDEAMTPEQIQQHIRNTAVNVAGDAVMHHLKHGLPEGDSGKSIAVWMRDRIKNRTRRAGIPIKELELEDMAFSEANRLAPHIAGAVSQVGYANGPQQDQPPAGHIKSPEPPKPMR